MFPAAPPTIELDPLVGVAQRPQDLHAAKRMRSACGGATAFKSFAKKTQTDPAGANAVLNSEERLLYSPLRPWCVLDPPLMVSPVYG